MAFRVGLIGLGMAVTPHAKSLLDLRDRVEVAYAYSPSAERRAKFKQKFPFPQTARLEDILDPWFQYRERQTCRSYTHPETGMNCRR